MEKSKKISNFRISVKQAPFCKFQKFNFLQKSIKFESQKCLKIFTDFKRQKTGSFMCNILFLS